jgi:hypothetical protein
MRTNALILATALAFIPTIASTTPINSVIGITIESSTLALTLGNVSAQRTAYQNALSGIPVDGSVVIGAWTFSNTIFAGGIMRIGSAADLSAMLTTIGSLPDLNGGAATGDAQSAAFEPLNSELGQRV